MTLTFGSLFAGIGGLDLGLERAGMKCQWQVEIDDYCQWVLAKHWPDVRRFADVKEVHGAVAHAEGWDAKESKARNRREGIGRGSQEIRRGVDGQCPSCLPPVDLVAGGFPCQPHSVAGKRKGAADDRNLWPEFSRIVGELRPRWVVAENVPGIVTTYLDTVLSDLEGQGYTCGTFNLPACAFDAPHRRERIFVVAYAERDGHYHAKEGFGPDGTQGTLGKEYEHGQAIRNGEDVADAEKRTEWAGLCEGQPPQIRRRRSGNGSSPEETWLPEPNVGRVAHGISRRVDRLRGLGNAVVPQVAEWIGQRIMETEASA